MTYSVEIVAHEPMIGVLCTYSESNIIKPPNLNPTEALLQARNIYGRSSYYVEPSDGDEYHTHVTWRPINSLELLPRVLYEFSCYTEGVLEFISHQRRLTLWYKYMYGF
jgi:hypothetical protein